jgi:hypothetical protein
MRRNVLVLGVLATLALAGCGSAATPSSTPASTPPASTTVPSAAATTAPVGTTAAAPTATTTPAPTTPAPTTALSPPPTAAVTTALPGVPAGPLPDTAANAATNAQYACKWYGELAELLSNGGSPDSLPNQAEADIQQVSQFAESAGADDSAYAKLARDGKALDSGVVVGELGVPAQAVESPQMKAVGADCDSLPAS